MLLKLPVSPALPVVPGPPKQLKSPPAIPVWLVQSVQLTDLSAQSATHSVTFPTMSNTPQLDLQFDREPVLALNRSSQHCSFELIVGARRGPRRESASRGSCAGGWSTGARR